jgi:NitT/TauT family transport system ATP-binding protein
MTKDRASVAPEETRQGEAFGESGEHICVTNVTKAFAVPAERRKARRDSTAGQRVALRDTSFAVQRGEFVSIVGPSGCGKTTLLRMIAGLTPVDQGGITIDGAPVRGPGRDRAVVFQQASLLPWASVVDNIAFGLRLRGVSAATRRERAGQLVKLVGLDGFEQHLPNELSGGMQQRVGLARALAIDPEILLLDEPFGSLDEITRRQMQDELLQLWGRTRLTSVLVTHSVDEALILSDRVLVMAGRPGRVVDDITVDIPRPRSRDAELTSQFVLLRQRIWDHLAGAEGED